MASLRYPSTWTDDLRYRILSMRAFTNHLQPYYFPSHSRNWRRSITGHFGSLVTTLIDQRNVSRALGILGIMIGAGPILGPSVGGLFLAINAWRFIFFG